MKAICHLNPKFFNGTGMAMLHSSSSEDDAQNVGITLMQGIATGSLLYVVFFEVIEKERAGNTSHALQLVFIILGSLTIIGLKVLEDVLSQDEDSAVEGFSLHNNNQTLEFSSDY